MRRGVSQKKLGNLTLMVFDEGNPAEAKSIMEFATPILAFLLRAIKLIAIAVALHLLLLFFLQRKILYPAPEDPLPQPLPDDVIRLDLTEGYGLFLNAATAATDRRPVILFAHGNGECAHWFLETFRQYPRHGYSVLLLEFPGYGEATGSANYDSLRRNVLAAYDLLAARDDIDATRIVAWGRSIGSGPIGVLAAERPIAALILESGFASLRDLVVHHRKPGFLLRDRFDNTKIVAAFQQPLLIYHGTQDTLIPIHFARQLRDLAADVRYQEVPCGHDDCPHPIDLVLPFLAEKLEYGPQTPTQEKSSY